MRAFTAAAIQLAPRPGPLTAASIKANVDNAVGWVERCVAATGAELVVLPESTTTGFDPALPPADLHELVEPIPGALTEPIQQVAARLQVHVCVGSYERGPAPRTVYNTAALIGPDGAVLGAYRKTHLYTGESVQTGGWVTAGDSVTVVDTELARIGTVICFDGDYPELARIQAVQGAEVLLRPSALLRSADIWELTTRARAYDNHVYVVAANAVGMDPGGALYFGNSLIVTPTAEVVARGTTQEGWVAARLDPAAAMMSISPGSSQPQRFDHLADRNTALYRRYADELIRECESPFRANHT
ncbi:MAG TPA: carbon-nitrogen hydrolase family protein [Actinomycetes bacterium]|jgi:predicted amidohydrolase|nr:carbon-nitrogen hydrolase family protein [Actinomycetes bacterium]